MPNPINFLRDAFLLSDGDLSFPRIADAGPGGDGAARISLVNFGASEQGTQLTVTRTVYTLDATGAVTSAEPFTRAFEFFNEVELAGGGIASADDSRGSVIVSLGAADGTNFVSRVIDQTGTSFPDVELVALGTGGFVVSWLDSAADDAFRGEVTLQYFDADGITTSNQIRPSVEDETPEDQASEQLLVTTPSGGVGVFWIDGEIFTGDGVLKYAAFDASGNSVVAERALELETLGDEPNVSFRPDGSFLVVSDTDMAKIYAADGTAILSDAVDVTAGNDGFVQAQLLGEGFVVATRTQLRSDEDVFLGFTDHLQLYGDDGAPIGDPVQYAGFESADGFLPSVRNAQIAPLGADGFVVTWEQDGAFFGATSPVLAQVFSVAEGGITANRAPVITTSSAISLDENATDPFMVQARDADGDDISFSIAPSDDAALFEIDPQSGALRFGEPQDFENPSDLDGDALYHVSVTADDGQGGSLTLPIEVTLTNLAETEANGPQAADYDFAYIYGNENNNIFPTFFIDDFSVALETNDFIDLGGGNDVVQAAGGDDYIIAGPGQDFSISGGAGRDIFRFGDGDEFVRLRDFTPGEDLIFLADGLTLGDLDTQSVAQGDGGTGVRYTTPGGDRLVIDNLAEGLSPADLFTAQSPLPRNAEPTLLMQLGGPDYLRPENEANAGQAFFSDANEDGLGLDISLSGADADLFQVILPDSSAFGGITTIFEFIDTPDFERPADANGDNVYEYTVTVTDSRGLATREDATVTVTDVNDGPPVGGDLFEQVIRGTDADDRLSGTIGSDYIIAGDGADFIRASGGSDLIEAGSGLDYRVFGGGGEDLFVFDGDSDRIRVLDFELGADSILLGEGVELDDLRIRDWSASRSLDDGSNEIFGGINIFYTDPTGKENRFTIAIDGRAPDAGDIDAISFILARDFDFPVLLGSDLLL